MVDFISMFTGMSERDIGLLLKTIVQDSINSQLTNADISDIDNKTPILITNSKDVELINDISVQSAINIESTSPYLMPEEPDGNNLKLWLKFQNVGELRDWSYQKNKSYSTGGNTMPGLFSKYNENSMLKYELYSYFNGKTHYAYTEDSASVRILPNITSSKITSFFMRLVPVSLSRVLYADNNALFTKVDDDQLRYGYSVTVDLNGSLHFYIRNNYRQFYLFVKDAYNYILTDPLYDRQADFAFENYSKKSFLTGFEYLCGLVAEELPFHDWFFKYNPSTQVMTAINTSENNLASVFADTTSIVEKPYLSCPIQEGKWTHSGTVQTKVYDNSGNNNDGTITGYVTGGQWNDDNTLTSLGSNTAGTTGGMSIDWNSVVLLNTFTEFTISFWFNPGTELINNKSYNTLLVSKGYAVASSIYIERTAGQNNLKFSFRAADNVEKSVTFSNPFTVQNKWYFVVARWKTGEKLKLSVNNVEVLGASNVSATLSTAANTIKLYSTTRAPIGTMALLKFDSKQVLQTTIDDWYYQGYHNPLFPKSENIQPVQEEDPDPIFVPFSNAYTLDKPTTPVLEDYRRINSLIGNSPLIPRYTVVDGVGVANPELNPYSIADGVTTGGGSTAFTVVQGPGTAGTTIESSDSSNGKLGDVTDGNKRVALRIKGTGATVAANLLGKTITKAQFDLKRIGTVTGTVYCKIWNAAGTEVATIGSIAASSLLDGTYRLETFTNTSNTVAIPAGSAGSEWRIGVEYTTGASGHEVDVRRKSGGGVDDSVNQDSWDWDGTSWTSNGNPDFDIKCNLFYGGTGSPLVDPWIIMKSGSYNRVTEAFGNADPIMGKTIGKVTLRLKKSGSPTGTATIALLNNASPPAILATFGTVDVANDLTTSFQDITKTNYVHGIVTASGHRIGIVWTPSASGEVHVMTNQGNTTSNSWQGTTSYVLSYITGWSSNTSIDLAGKIYTGGNNFFAFIQFKDGVTRLATKAVNSSSSLHNRKITNIMSRMAKVGSPSGIVTATIRDANDVVKVQFSGVDVDTIPADVQYHDTIFVNNTHNYRINSDLGSGDKISFEYTGTNNSTNYIEINTNHDVIDGLNTITQVYTNGNYTDQAQRDLAGIYYEGGEPDLVSRTRVAQSVEHQSSRLKGKKITRVKAFLIRTGTASGTAYCNIRNSNDDLIKTLDTVAVSSLSTDPAIPSEITFENTTNNYPLTVNDKVSIEFSGGDSSNQVGVLVRSVTPNYDGNFSYIRKFDEFDWDDEETTLDLCAVMDEGGYFFTPDPFSIPDPTPTNIKDLLYCAGNNAKSGFFETFLMEFRIYSKDITLSMADNLYNNRYSISDIGNGELLMPFSFRISSVTEP